MSEKKFDITQYEWTDSDIQYSHRSLDDIYFDIKGTQLPIFINKQDVIAMAKHFKLTAEDLKLNTREKVMNLELNQSVNYWPYKNLLFKGKDEKYVHLEDKHGNKKKVYIDLFIKHGSIN